MVWDVIHGMGWDVIHGMGWDVIHGMVWDVIHGMGCAVPKVEDCPFLRMDSTFGTAYAINSQVRFYFDIIVTKHHNKSE